MLCTVNHKSKASSIDVKTSSKSARRLLTRSADKKYFYHFYYYKYFILFFKLKRNTLQQFCYNTE